MGEAEKLHRDRTLANLLDGKVAEPQWNYRNFALGGADSEFITIQDGIKYYNAEVGGNVPPTRKNVWRNAATADVNGSSAWDGPGGLTGSSGGWQTAEYSFGDLSGTVWLRFRYMTDEAANGKGWYVDDLRAGSYVGDDTLAGWTTSGFMWTTGLQANDWTADAYVPYAKAKRKTYAVVPIVRVDGQGLGGSSWLATNYTKQSRITAVMSNRPDGVFPSTGRLVVAKQKSATVAVRR